MMPAHSDATGGRSDMATSTSQDAAPAAEGQKSFIHQGFTDIGRRLKACNDTLGELQQLGVQHVAHLPELVLVGDQSAGKSSLMSGLAEMNLPRSGGVCTRCPIHIRLSRSNDSHFSCTVSLLRDYEYKPPGSGRIAKSDVTRAKPFFPWEKMSHRDTQAFKTIHDKSEIEDVLRWAQIGVLNPNKSHEQFVPGEGAYAKDKSLSRASLETEAQFSPNIVSVEMKGDNLPDLSFYDLPGVFLSASRVEDEYIVRVVRNLTKEYIQRPEAIILWALPMNQDIELSICLSIVRENGAKDRTIGVMTKADMLPADNVQSCLQTLKNENNFVGHGFFITSRPPDEALDLALVAQWEEGFFNRRTGSWPTEFEAYADRCGVDRLKTFLCKKLGDAFAESLPSIKHKVYSRLGQIKDELAQLPEMPHNVEHEVRKSLFDLFARVKAAMQDAEFKSRWNTLNEHFEACIMENKPTCVVKDQDPRPNEPTDQSDDQLALGLMESHTPSRRRQRAGDATMRTPIKRTRVGNGNGGGGSYQGSPLKEEYNSRAGPATPATPATPTTPASHGGDGAQCPTPFTVYQGLCRGIIDLQKIRSELLLKKRPGLPGDFVPEEVYDSLAMACVAHWRDPLETYMECTVQLLSALLEQTLLNSFGILRQRLIFKRCRQYLHEFLDGEHARQRAKLIDLLETEAYQMFTMNNATFNANRDRELLVLTNARTTARVKRLGITWASLPADELVSGQKEAMDRAVSSLPVDPFHIELKVAATVRGYYLQAASRFVESVTMSVNARLFRGMAQSTLDMYVNERLGMNGADQGHFEMLMAEDEQTADRRQQLKREKEKLARAMQSIIDLESSSSPAAAASYGFLSHAAADEDMFMDEI